MKSPRRGDPAGKPTATGNAASGLAADAARAAVTTALPADVAMAAASSNPPADAAMAAAPSNLPADAAMATASSNLPAGAAMAPAAGRSAITSAKTAAGTHAGATHLSPFRSRVRLRHLQCFVTVAQTGHLGRAGARLGLTQPAVSKTLTELEDMVGTRLLTRQRAGTSLTADGMRFLRHALRVMEGLDAAAESLEGAAAHPVECVRIGALPSIVPALLLDAVNGFRQRHPDVGLTVRTDMNRMLIDSLKADVFDLVLGRMDDPAAMEGLWFESLGPEPLLFAVRVGHPLARGGGGGGGSGSGSGSGSSGSSSSGSSGSRSRSSSDRDSGGGHGRASASLADALSWPLVVPALGSIPRHSLESLLARHGLALPRGCLETADAYLGSLVTRTTDSVWAAPTSAIKRLAGEGALTVLPIATQGTEEPIGLLRRADRALSTSAEAFAREVRAMIA